MLALKRLVTILVMLFLVLALLILLLPSVQTSFVGMAGSAESLYYTLLAAAVALLGLHLLTENLDSTLLRREMAASDRKINELKARLYDNQLEQQRAAERPPITPRTGVTTYPDQPLQPQPDPNPGTVPGQQSNVIIPPADSSSRPL
ncbi:hypothetical protein J7E24_08585 [Hymenobacter sp. ISL-91]|uniref:hypothetical protein n=1 Tax=Hymenobacter sp. ISL-91 TaxID=2819151 RepID=UPI001BEC633F|nr:hypothetical protein [Hymenobacter sp. ISL-91]MBT2557839.1 hypothetical protein [Hymenobacter sp. ISL-91]